MPIAVNCPECGSCHHVDENARGERIRCGDCGAVFNVAVGSPGISAAGGTHSSSGSQSGFGKASLWLGVSIWGLAALFVLVMVAMGVSVMDIAPGEEPPAGAIAGLLFVMIFFQCVTMCISPLVALLGVVFGCVALGDRNAGKAAAIVGLILNGAWLLLELCGFALMIVGGAANAG